MKTILILCTGNSCRSQMVEAYLQFFAGEKAIIQSAGIEPKGLHPLAVQVMQEDGIDITAQCSSDILEFDKQTYDYVITVCENARAKLPPSIQSNNFIHWPIDDSAEVSGTLAEKLDIFRNARETIKKDVLRFLGREFPLPLMLAM